jgi:hypothetical protein
MQGKGHVVRRMFADVEADIYVMADGDATYDGTLRRRGFACRAVARRALDMVVGARKVRSGGGLSPRPPARLPPLHRHPRQPVRAQLHRHILRLPSLLSPFREELSGTARGFETETEISVHALELAMPVGEIVTAYGALPEGSVSKLLHLPRRLAIMKTSCTCSGSSGPVLFYGRLRGFLTGLALVLAVPLILTYAQTGLVPRFPTAILITGLMTVAFISFAVGLILDTVVRGRREVRRLHYLGYPAPGE